MSTRRAVRRAVVAGVAGLAVSLAASGCRAGGGTSEPVGAAPTPTSTVLTSPPPTLSADGTTRLNVPYVTDGDPLHGLDLYLPPQRTGPVPVLVWVHGGGWRRGDKTDLTSGLQTKHLQKDLLDRGIAVASVNYRLLPRAHFPAPVQDVSAAVRYLKSQAGTLGLDGGRVALAGDSAGAQLAGLVAMLAPGDTLHGTLGTPGDSSVKAFVGYYGSYDFLSRSSQSRAQGCTGATAGAGSSYGRYIGADPDSALAKALALRASVVSHVRGESPATLLFHGTKDCTVPYRQSVELAERLRDRGVIQRLVTVDAGHADARFYSDRELRRTAIDFVAAQLGVA